MNLASPPPQTRRSRRPAPDLSGGPAPASIRSCVRGVGAALPARVVSNEELAAAVDTSDEWIVQRTGIRQRYIAGAGETTSSLAAKAAEAALAAGGLEPADIDLVIVATSTPDFTFPAVATQVQAHLGIVEGAAFDLQAVCTGFVYAVATADKFLRSGSNKRALVIGAETFSRILDWNDRGTCVLFGDGAGAIVMRAEEGKGTSDDRGVLANALHSDGRQHDILYVDGGPSSTKTTGFLRMEGKEVFKQAVVNMAAVVGEVLDKVGLAPRDIDWLVPHQANKRIIDGTGRKLGLPPERVVITVDRHANTSAASIPLALDVAVKDGRIKRGDLLLLEGIGGGLAWGASLIRW